MQALVLAPTHELVMQIDAQIKLLNTNSDSSVTSLTIIGESNIEKQIKKLKEIKRVYSESSKTEEVTIIIPKKERAYWNIDKQDFTIEPGRINILIGTSSEDKRSEGSIKL